MPPLSLSIHGNCVKPKRLAVLFVTPWYPSKEHVYSGVFVREYAKALQKHINVVVLHIGIADQTIPHWWATQTEGDEKLNEGIPSYRAVYKAAQMRGCSWPRYWISVVRAARVLSNIHGPFDIIHAHVFSSGPAALLIGKWYNAPVVISEHSSSFSRELLSRLQIRKARWVFRRAGAVLPVSHTLQAAIAQYGIEAAFRVVPNTVNTRLFCCESFRPEKDGTVQFLAVTSFAENKGLAVLLRALSQVQWREKVWHLHVVGGNIGPNAARHRQIADDLGLTAHVTYHGSIQKSEVARMMHGADLFILPSLVETFSVATAEALVAGLPVLVTRCGGPEEFVDERCGLIVPPGDAAALAEGVSMILGRLASYDRKEIFRIASERFGYEAISGALEDVYAQVARTKPTFLGRPKPTFNNERITKMTTPVSTATTVHQINLQLQAEQHPLVKDDSFGSLEGYISHLIHLRAYEEAAWVVAGKSVLDVGCNVGYGIQVLASSATSIAGIDVSPQAVKAAQQRLGPTADIRLYDGVRCSFPGSSFDVATSFQVIEHVSDYRTYLSEIIRLLRPDGTFVITTPNARLRLDPGMKPWNQFHVREFHPFELKELLSIWFEEVEVRGLFGNPELYEIERNRCERARYAARSSPSRRRRFLRQGLSNVLPWLAPVCERLRTLTKRKEKQVRLPRSKLAQFSTRDLFYRNDSLDEALDLMALCRKPVVLTKRG